MLKLPVLATLRRGRGAMTLCAVATLATAWFLVRV
jgi:hypothetical protein